MMPDPARGGRPIKVVRVIARLNVGGPARHVVLLDEGLQRLGYRTLLVHGSIDVGEASLEDLARDRQIATLKLPLLGRRVGLVHDIRVFAALVRLIRRVEPDVVHTHTAKAGTLGRLAAFAANLTRPRKRRAVLVHTFHGHVLSGYFSRAGNIAVRAVERALGAVTDRVVTIAPAQRRDITDRFRIAPPGRTVVVPLGLELRELLDVSAASPNLRREFGIDDADVVVGFVGRLVAIKNVRTLVEGFARALDRQPNMFLLIAGDGPQRARLEQLVDELGIAGRVRFAGWLRDLPSLYATLDVCALSSLNEGTPVALIESMAAGKPVVATSVGGVSDLVDHEKTGLLVPARDAEALGGALLRLAGDRELRSRLGSAGRSLAARQYTVGRLVEDMDRLYAEALLERRGTATVPASAT
jgi:glycosyltransferase involved in cell wall biosynthesis